ncbi:MAG: polymer-forming cytoskeletal protein [candidate division Zixibacteria bacterium]|nr:polymer-forming cytoskeletal protein [candidate division Zixibacteria bacterium]
MKIFALSGSKLLLFACGALATHSISISNLYSESASIDSISSTSVVSVSTANAPVLAKGELSADTISDDTVFIRTEVRRGKIRSRDIQGDYWRYDIRSETFEKLGRSEQRSIARERDREGFDYPDYSDELENRPEEWATHLRKIPRVSVHDIRINVDEYVTRSITARGKVIVHGLVEGDVISQEAIIVSPTGMIDGDAIAPRIRVRDGGIITGTEGEEDMPTLPGLPDLDDDRLGVIINLGAVAVFAAILIGFLVVAFVAISVKPVIVSRISLVIDGYPLRATMIGLLVCFLFGPAVGLVSATIVGIPIAILAVLAFPVGLLLGLVAFTQLSGKFALRAYGEENASQLRQIVVGASMLIGLWMIAVMLIDSSSEFLEGWGIFFLVASILYSIPAVFSGIGGVFLTRFGRREYSPPGPDEHAEVAPPPPTPPPIPSPPETSGSAA